MGSWLALNLNADKFRHFHLNGIPKVEKCSKACKIMSSQVSPFNTSGNEHTSVLHRE